MPRAAISIWAYRILAMKWDWKEGLEEPALKGSRDKYEVYVNNQIIYYLGQEGAHYIHTHFDTDISNAVLIIDIEPCPTPKAVGNVYYERMGRSARKVNETYKDKFLAIRKQWAEEHIPCCGCTGRNADCVRKHSSHQGVKKLH